MAYATDLLKQSAKLVARKALTSLSAFCPSNNVVLCEKQVGKGKAEMSCLPDILETLNLKGHTVTIDHAGAYKHLIDKIREKGAHYVIGLKANQPKAYKAAQEHFETLENQTSLDKWSSRAYE